MGFPLGCPKKDVVLISVISHCTLIGKLEKSKTHLCALQGPRKGSLQKKKDKLGLLAQPRGGEGSEGV